MSISGETPQSVAALADEADPRHKRDVPGAADVPTAPPGRVAQRPPRFAQPVASQKLGEELPVFCERCGYQLFGLTPLRCERCDILHFHCPECAHHQPINTLRPAAQRIIGRVRGAWLVLVIVFKINFFFWALFAFGAATPEMSYRFDEVAWAAQQQQYQSQQAQYQAALTAYNQALGAQAAAQAANPATAATQPAPLPPTPPIWSSPARLPRPLRTPERVALSIMGALFGMIGRMMLLRWRRGIGVGAALAALVAVAIVLGTAIYRAKETQPVPWPWPEVGVQLLIFACGTAIGGAVVVWPIWSMLVRAFLPMKTGNALLEWQRSLSNRVSALARDTVGT